MTTTLSERGGSRVKIPEGKGELIDIRIMGWEPGAEFSEGSSGDYPVAAIKRDFAEAFPVGTRMRANHDGLCEAGGDIRRIMAKTVEAPRTESDGMYAKARVREGEATDFIRQFADVIGVSVSVGVELETEPLRDDDGDPVLDHENKPVMVTKIGERGLPIVKRFLSQEESPYNSVDFVEAPGADGRIVAVALESAKAVYEHTQLREAATFAKGTVKPAITQENSAATPPRSNEEEDMDDAERRQIAKEAADAAVAEAMANLRPQSTESEQPTLAAQSEAVIAAGLTEAGRAEVYARVERGETLEAAVAAETAREASIEAEVQRRVEAASATRTDEGAFGFGYTSDDTTGSKLGTESGTDRQKLDEEYEALVAEEA